MHTHISTGGDFFKIEVGDCDCIVSNPPYSIKTEIFEELFRIGKPFAMLVPIAGIFESQRRFNLFRFNNFECIYFDKRIEFFTDFITQKSAGSPFFSSGYICHKILPKQIISVQPESTFHRRIHLYRLVLRDEYILPTGKYRRVHD